MKQCYRLLGILVVMMALPGFTFGQVCTPDSSFISPGIYPAILPPACAGISYSTNLTIVVPVDTVVSFPPVGTFTIPIDSIILNAVIGLPSGFTLSCEPMNCALPGGAIGCVNIAGTSNTPDTIVLDVALTTYLNTPFGPLTQPDTLEGYFTLFINPGFGTSILTTDSDCASTNGTAKVLPTGGATPFTYSWSTGASTDSIGNLAAGQYTVMTTDASGCVKPDTVVISTVGPNPVVAADSIFWSGCASNNNGGAILLAVSGGTSPYTYVWSNGGVTDSLSGLPAGMYSVSVTDAQGCVGLETFQLTAPAELTLSTVNTNNLSCHDDNSGSIEIAVAGGTGGNVFTWTGLPNAIGPIVENLPAGSYSVTVEDDASCVKTLSFTLTEPDPIAITFQFTGETAYDQKDGSALANPSGGTTPYTFAWSNGATTDLIEDLEPGWYVLTLTDANGCVSVDSVEVPAVALSIEDRLGIQAFGIAPNPSQGAISITWDLGYQQSAQLRLRDLRGALVQDWGSIGVRGEIRTTLGLPAGMYLIEMVTTRGIGHRKLIIE